MTAIAAGSKIDLLNREDFRQALKSCLITDHKFIPLFDQLFDLYWRNPDRIENVSEILRKLYESRLSQAELQSMKDQIKELYNNRLENLKEKEKNVTEDNEEKMLDVFYIARKKFCGANVLMLTPPMNWKRLRNLSVNGNGSSGKENCVVYM